MGLPLGQGVELRWAPEATRGCWGRPAVVAHPYPTPGVVPPSAGERDIQFTDVLSPKNPHSAIFPDISRYFILAKRVAADFGGHH